MKRFLSLILALLMVAAAVPVLGAAIIAAPIDTSSMTEEEAYEHYKGLYYDDGHLKAFLNMHSITKDDIGYLTDSDFALTGEDARLVLGYTEGPDGLPLAAESGKPDPGRSDLGTNTKGYHSYIKIIGGEYAGRYYMIATDKGKAEDAAATGFDMTKPITLTQKGFVNFNNAFQADNTGIFFGAALSFEQIQDKYRSLAVADGLSGELTGTEFYLPAEEKLFNGTYGNFTIEEVVIACYNDDGGNYHMLRNKDKHLDYNMHILRGVHTSGGTGTVRIVTNGDNCSIQQFGTGAYHNLGVFSSITLEQASTIHFSYVSYWKDAATMNNKIHLIAGYDGTVTEIKSAATGRPYDYTVAPNPIMTHAVQTGFRPYFIRFYDCELTKAQMAQNHFADLCYYYRLANAEKLITLGSLALDYDFYAKFLQYDVGSCSNADIEYMQKQIDSACKIYDDLDVGKVKSDVLKNATALQNYHVTAKGAVDDIDAIISDINGYIENARTTVPANQQAQALLDNAIAMLNIYKDQAIASKAEIDRYYSIVKNAYDTVSEANTAAQSSSDLDYVLTNKNTIESKQGAITDNSLRAVYAAEISQSIADAAIQQMYLAGVANANASLAPNRYIRFAGYQQNLTGYFGMRAIYVIDETLINAGYTHEGEKYDIIDFGFVSAYKTDDPAGVTIDFTVTKDKATGKVNGISSVTSSNSGAHIIRAMNDKRTILNDPELQQKVAIKEGVIGTIYSHEKNFIDVGYADYANAFTQEYSFRAYIIVTNGDATFIKYVDAIGDTLGDSVSLYRLADAINKSNDEVSKKPEYLVSQTLYYVNQNAE